VSNRALIKDFNNLNISINESLLGIGVNNNIFEAVNKSRSDILQSLSKQENVSLNQSSEIVDLIN